MVDAGVAKVSHESTLFETANIEEHANFLEKISFSPTSSADALLES